MNQVEKTQNQVSTEEIRLGLERIKKAQQEVLKELRKDQVEEKSSQAMIKLKRDEIMTLRRQIKVEQDRAIQSNLLYNRRIEELENELNTVLEREKQLATLKYFSDQRIEILEKENKGLQKQIQFYIDENNELREKHKNYQGLSEKIDDGEFARRQLDEMKRQYYELNEEKDTLVQEKINLLKAKNQLESENNELKNFREDEKCDSFNLNRHKLIQQINSINKIHENLSLRLKGITRLTKQDLINEEMYQNSLNTIVRALQEDGTEAFSSRFTKDTKSPQKIQRQVLTLEKEIFQLREELRTEKQDKQFYIKEFEDIKEMMEKIRAKQKTVLEKQSPEIGEKQAQYQLLITELNDQMNQIRDEKNNMKKLMERISFQNPSKNDSQREIERLRNRITDLTEDNDLLRDQNHDIKERIDSLLLQKEQLHFQLHKGQQRIEQLSDKLQKQAYDKDNLMAQNLKDNEEIELLSMEMGRTKKEIQELKGILNATVHKSQVQMQNQTKQLMTLRSQNESLYRQRRELKELRAINEKLEKQKQFIAKKTKHSNHRIDHLWAIKEVEYGNIHRVIREIREK